jgi:transcriptional regulator with XRE-family HTH domain
VLLALILGAWQATKEEAMPSKSELGRRIRQARVEKALTLKEVEGRSGVSATHISQIERGITSPTVNALERIARALEKNTSFFLEDVELPEICHLQNDGREIVISERPKIVLKSLTHGIPGGVLHMYMMIANPSSKGGQEVKLHEHEGDECGYVIDGRLEIRVGEEVIELGPGDSVHFKATMPHGVRTIGDEVSHSVWAATSIAF